MSEIQPNPPNLEAISEYCKSIMQIIIDRQLYTDKVLRECFIIEPITESGNLPNLDRTPHESS